MKVDIDRQKVDKCKKLLVLYIKTVPILSYAKFFSQYLIGTLESQKPRIKLTKENSKYSIEGISLQNITLSLNRRQRNTTATALRLKHKI